MIREKIILEKAKNKDVLDIGSIGQTESYSLWDIYRQVKVNSLTGIDLSQEENEALNNYYLDRLQNNESIVKGNMENYQFNRQFDLIVAGDVIEHVNNQGLFLQNIHKHLKDEGELIITTPNAKWWTVFLKPNPTHTLWHDKYTLKRILNMNGFIMTFFRYYYGNKKSYNLLFKILALRQGIIGIFKKIG